jgi:hypothetical protein
MSEMVANHLCPNCGEWVPDEEWGEHPGPCREKQGQWRRARVWFDGHAPLPTHISGDNVEVRLKGPWVEIRHGKVFSVNRRWISVIEWQ